MIYSIKTEEKKDILVLKMFSYSDIIDENKSSDWSERKGEITARMFKALSTNVFLNYLFSQLKQTVQHKAKWNIQNI